MSTTNHQRKETYPLDKIMPLIGNDDQPIVILDGDDLRLNRKSLRIYKEKGHICVKCGAVGYFFAKEKDVNCHRWHLNLYARHPKTGRPVLMTKDHILPSAKGGRNGIENLQPMCTKCNNNKGDSLEDINTDMKLYETKLDPLGRVSKNLIRKIWGNQVADSHVRIYNERSGSRAPTRRKISVEPWGTSDLKDTSKRKEYFDSLQLEIYKRYADDIDIKNIGDLQFKTSDRAGRMTLTFQDPTLPPIPQAEKEAWEERRGGKHGEVVRKQ